MFTSFEYCQAEEKILGLHDFFVKFHILADYVMIFNFVGNDSLFLLVYDSQGMNHLRDEDGNFRFEDFVFDYGMADNFHICDSTEDSSTDSSDDS